MNDNPTYPPEFFQRMDESDDRLFYAEPRLVAHIDDRAIAAIRRYLSQTLPEGGVILDLMSSWLSHLPTDFHAARVVGLGLNDVEMRENAQLDTTTWYTTSTATRASPSKTPPSTPPSSPSPYNT